MTPNSDVPGNVATTMFTVFLTLSYIDGLLIPPLRESSRRTEVVEERANLKVAKEDLTKGFNMAAKDAITRTLEGRKEIAKSRPNTSIAL